MNMNSAGTVYFGVSSPELPDNFLNGFDISILTDRGYHLYRILTPRSPVVSVLATDRGIAHDLPLPAGGVPDCICVISSAYMTGVRAKIPCDDPGGCRPCPAGHLDFDAEVLISQS